MADTGYPDFGVPKQIAAEIAAGGVPLISASTGIFDLTGQTVAPGTPYTTAILGISGVSYEAATSITCGAAATVPFVKVQLHWYSSSGGGEMGTTTWIVPASSGTGGFYVLGHGPAEAAYVSATFTNLDPSVDVTVSAGLRSQSVVRDRHDWRWLNYLSSGWTVPGSTLASLPDDESVLGMLSGVTVAAGATDAYVFGSYAGRVYFGLQQISGPSTALTIRIAPQPNSEYAGDNPMGQFSVPSPGIFFMGVRAPLRIQLYNSSTSAVELSAIMVADP